MYGVARLLLGSRKKRGSTSVAALRWKDANRRISDHAAFERAERERRWAELKAAETVSWLEVSGTTLVAGAKKHLFAKADANGDGVLQRSEFQEAATVVLSDCGLADRIASLQSFLDHEWNTYDADDSSSIDFEEFGAWVVRFLDYCLEQRALRDAGIDAASNVLALPHGSSAKLLQQSLRHCATFTELQVCGGELTNQGLFSVAQVRRDALLSVDLSSSAGFDGHGLRAFAAYCPSLRTLRLTGCAACVDEACLAVIGKCCPALTTLAVGGCCVRLSALEGTLPPGCTIEGVPLGLPVDTAQHGEPTAAELEELAQETLRLQREETQRRLRAESTLCVLL